MKEIGKRLRMLRDNIHVSQDRLAKEFGITQSSINRYENGQTTPTVEIFRKYADFFDVSMDYIFARTDNPAGKAYGMHAKLTPEKEEMRRFIEMCFEPGTKMNKELRLQVVKMLSEEKK